MSAAADLATPRDGKDNVAAPRRRLIPRAQSTGSDKGSLGNLCQDCRSSGAIDMPQAWQAFRSGSWLTHARARGYSLTLLVIAALSIVTWIALSNGLVDRNHKPIGTDFSSFY